MRRGVVRRGEVFALGDTVWYLRYRGRVAATVTGTYGHRVIVYRIRMAEGRGAGEQILVAGDQLSRREAVAGEVLRWREVPEVVPSAEPSRQPVRVYRRGTEVSAHQGCACVIERVRFTCAGEGVRVTREELESGAAWLGYDVRFPDGSRETVDWRDVRDPFADRGSSS